MKYAFEAGYRGIVAAVGGLGVAGLLSSAHAAIVSPVYGVDDRRDLFELEDRAWVIAARSTVALVSEKRLVLDESEGGGAYVPATRALGKARNLCEGERFTEQPSLSFCSGALVGKDLVLTAGHCIESLEECQGTRFVFGYGLGSATESVPRLASANVYSCKEILARSSGWYQPDFAVIRLDRAVEDRQPLKINREDSLREGAEVVLIGHPNGLPTKVSPGARVRLKMGEAGFRANLDAFSGSSGSPVLNAHTGLIEGILVSGERDYDESGDGSCKVVHPCSDDGCTGERSTAASVFASHIPDPDAEEPAAIGTVPGLTSP